MEDNILISLYNGRIIPSERGTKHIQGYGELGYELSEHWDYFRGKLSEEDFDRLKTMETIYSAESNLEKFDMFCYAFRLATQLCVEGSNSLDCEG